MYPSTVSAAQEADAQTRKKDTTLEADLLTIVAPHTAGDPMTTRRWLNCRLCDLQVRLARAGHTVSQPVISPLLRAHNYRLHLNVKGDEGKVHPQRHEQFEHLLAQRQPHLASGQPCLSVDTKKKELIASGGHCAVGNFKSVSPPHLTRKKAHPKYGDTLTYKLMSVSPYWFILLTTLSLFRNNMIQLA